MSAAGELARLAQVKWYRCDAAAAAREIDRRVLNADAVDDRRELAADFGNAERRCILGGAGEWRVRTGDYRIVYEIRDDELLVLVLQVGHRDVHRRRG